MFIVKITIALADGYSLTGYLTTNTRPLTGSIIEATPYLSAAFAARDAARWIAERGYEARCTLESIDAEQWLGYAA